MVHKIHLMLTNKLFLNSFWSVASSLFQNAIFSVFFIIMARSYETVEFSEYILANTLYGMILSFSSLGLSQWYIREYHEGQSSVEISTLFFKIQFFAGILFYIVNISLSYLLYTQSTIHLLSILLGINIVFDNLIHVYKTINIISFQQRQTFQILSIEALMKLSLGIYVLYQAPDIIIIAILLVVFRVITLSMFLQTERNGLVQIKKMFRLHLDTAMIFKTLYNNRFFLIIGSISVLFWSVGNILVSKFLEIERVADYEISFKLFTIAEIIPVMVSSTLFPVLVEKVKLNHLKGDNFIRSIFIANLLYGLFVYTFITSFSIDLIPLLFGVKYSLTASYCNEMFLTILFFPSVLFQANLLVALKMERIDMYLNLLSLLINLGLAISGLYVTKSLSVINYSIFISFFIFHLSQEIYLIKKGITTIEHALTFYSILIFILFGYTILKTIVPVVFLFPIFWVILLFVFLPQLKNSRAKA